MHGALSGCPDSLSIDRRWALLALSPVEVFCLVIDVRLFRDDLTAIGVVSLLASMLLPLASVPCRARRARALVTGA